MAIEGGVIRGEGVDSWEGREKRRSKVGSSRLNMLLMKKRRRSEGRGGVKKE